MAHYITGISSEETRPDDDDDDDDIFSALKIIIYDNIICFCFQTSEIKLNIIQFLYRN